MDQYFTRVSEIIQKGKIPLRIKFMLQDVQDLRANDWIPQGHEDSLKTIDQVGLAVIVYRNVVLRIFFAQIHHEAKVEEEKRKQLRALARNRTCSDAKSNGAMRPIEGTNLSDGDKKEKLDARKLQVLLKQRCSANLKQRQPLGPSISTFRPVGWRGGTKPMDGDKMEILGARKLQVLLKQRECGISFQDHAPFTFGSVEKQPARFTQAGLFAVQQQYQSASDRGKYRQDQQEMDELAAVRLKTMVVTDELIEDGDMEVLPLYEVYICVACLQHCLLGAE